MANSVGRAVKGLARLEVIAIAAAALIAMSAGYGPLGASARAGVSEVPEPAPTAGDATPTPGDKSRVRTKIGRGSHRNKIRGVRPVAPDGAPGSSSSSLGAGAEPSIGAGVRMPIGGGGNPDRKGAQPSERERPAEE
jgi:hypothetical protein